ncbi:Uncharacterized protein BgiBS90_024347, partial [Biomphalaria glabrata]
YSLKIYLSMVRAVLASIKVYSQTLQVTQAKAACFKTLTDECSKLNNQRLLDHIKDGSLVQFKLVSLNSNHSEESLTEGVHCKKMKLISLALYDIPSLHNTKQDHIGSMLFAESFLDSCIQLSGGCDVNSHVFILTSCIPRHQIWSLSGNDRKMHTSAPTLPIDFWGEPLMTQGDISMTGTWTALLPPERVVLTAWTHGVTVQTSDYGSVSLLGSDINSIALYDGDSMSKVTLLLLKINLTSIMADRLPPHVYSEVDERGMFTLILAFSPHTKAHTQLFGNTSHQKISSSKHSSTQLQYFKPVMTDYKELLKPVMTDYKELLKPVMTDYKELLKPVMTDYKELLKPVMTDYKELLKPVMTDYKELLKPVMTDYKELLKPVMTDYKELLKPVMTDYKELLKPVMTDYKELLKPVMTDYKELLKPVMTDYKELLKPVMTDYKELLKPVMTDYKELLKPVMTDYKELLKPVMTDYKELLKPVMTDYKELLKPVMTDYKELLKPVMTDYKELLKPVMTDYKELLKPVMTDYKELLKPVMTDYKELLKPVMTDYF